MAMVFITATESNRTAKPAANMIGTLEEVQTIWMKRETLQWKNLCIHIITDQLEPWFVLGSVCL